MGCEEGDEKHDGERGGEILKKNETEKKKKKKKQCMNPCSVEAKIIGKDGKIWQMRLMKTSFNYVFFFFVSSFVPVISLACCSLILFSHFTQCCLPQETGMVFRFL